jgi:hypothetical protein
MGERRQAEPEAPSRGRDGRLCEFRERERQSG